MKNHVSGSVISPYFLLFLLLTIWVASAQENVPESAATKASAVAKTPAKPTPLVPKDVTPVLPTETLTAEEALIIAAKPPEGPSLEQCFAWQRAAELDTLVWFLRTKGIRFGASASIEKILDHFRSYRPSVGESTAFLADEFHKLHEEMMVKIEDIRRYIPLSEREVRQLVETHLVPLLRLIHKHLK